MTTIIAAVVGPLVAILLAGLVGNKLAFAWELRRKQRDLDLNSLHEFYRLYGEFFALLKLWDSWKRRADKTEPVALERIVERATTAEGQVEALLLKVSAERTLGENEQDLLGAFRQGYQTLRESMRQDKTIDWNYSNYEPYAAFKGLACAISQLLSTERDISWNEAKSQVAMSSFRKITSNAYEFPRAGRLGGGKPWTKVADERGLTNSAQGAKPQRASADR
jgi:hypothetical protein